MSLQKAGWALSKSIWSLWIKFFSGKLKRINPIGMDEVVKGINLNKFAISWIAIEQYRAIYDKQNGCVHSKEQHCHVNIMFGSQVTIKVTRWNLSLGCWYLSLQLILWHFWAICKFLKTIGGFENYQAEEEKKQFVGCKLFPFLLHKKPDFS